MNCLAIFDPKYWRGPSFPLSRVVMNPPSVWGQRRKEICYCQCMGGFSRGTNYATEVRGEGRGRMREKKKEGRGVK